jgi:murein DD-endopeptidase MepM/ murein hydrolase activator NlpD
VRLAVALVAGCVIGPAQPQSAVINEYDVLPFAGGELHVVIASERGAIVETITNDYAVPAVIEATRHLDNLEPIMPAATHAVLAPHVRVELGAWRPRGALWNEHTEFRVVLGDPAATPTPYAYGLPFAHGETHELIQGFNSAFSHHDDGNYAIDFEMDEGTTVRAAREGVVVAFNDRATEHGLSPEFKDFDHANWVLVRHDDGTLGVYFHMQPHGVAVAVGTRVARGAVLGRSGFTGYTSRPHLHFEVRAAVDGIHFKTFPFELAREGGGSEPPHEGRRYTAFE